MTKLKAFIAALTIVAVAANPVAASLAPCCCTNPEKTERTCCHSAEQAAKAAKKRDAATPACCAKRHAPSDVMVRGGCCCIKAPPAIPASPDQTKQIIEQHSIQPATSQVNCIVHAPAIRRFEQLPGTHTLTGPPLLALYCTWLK